MCNYLKVEYFGALLVVIFLCTTPIVQAQMFSIDEPERQRSQRLGTTTVISAGWNFADFSFTGDDIPEEQRLDFNDNLFSLLLNSPGLDLGIAFGGSLTGMNENSYLNLSARIYNNFPLKRSSALQISIPIQLTTDLTQVSRDNTNTDFRQSSLVAGTGIYTIFKITNRINFQIKATPNYGFSFSQGSIFGGSLFRFDGDTKLLIHDLFGSRALSVGYNFGYKQYDIDGELNDYDFNGHTITIGIGL